MNNNIEPMPTQNPWAWVWAPNVGLCYAYKASIRLCGPYVVTLISWTPILFQWYLARIVILRYEIGLRARKIER